MEVTNSVKELREIIRVLERKLGMLNDLQSSCCGVTLAQCHALVEIGRAGRLSLNDLADILGLDKSTISRTINNLVISDLASREIDPQDRRFITIELTEKGMKAFREIEAAMGNYFAQIFNAIPVSKREQVIESLQLLVQSLPEQNCCR